MTLPAFTLYPTATVANAPFCLGHAFVKGDVPAGSQVVAPFADFQCTPKNAWPDGSLKFAVLAGRTDVTAGVPLAVQLSLGTPSAGTAIAASSVTASATVDCGAFGAVTWSGADWASPFSTWISGPKMSSFVYRKPVGSDAHLAAWLEVRVWAGGEMEVLPWIENGYFFKAGPTNKSATYTFTLGGTQRFSAAIDLKHHQRTPLVSGAALSHWLSTAPGVTPILDVAYLQQTELVPTYTATSTTAQLTALLPTTFAPLQQGGFDYSSDLMSSTGYASAIGLLPTHDVAYLVCADDPKRTYGAVVRNGYSAGRYGIHFRDETTNRPPLFATYPTDGLNDASSIKDVGAVNGSATPAATGGHPPQWDLAHCPSVGYMAYMVTGRFYFMEEAQFAAITNHFTYTDWVRAGGTDTNGYAHPGANGASGIYVGFPQTRSSAWGIRTLGQAASATPDGDALQAGLVHSVEENARYFKEIYAGQSANIFGNINGGEGSYNDWSGIYAVPMWQQNFVTAAWGMMLAMDLPISSTAKSNMTTFFAWKAKGIVGVLGTASDYWYVNGATYLVAASPTRSVNILSGSGPWYATFKQSYDALVANHVPAYGYGLSTTEGVLSYEDTVLRARGMWGNAMPAIAYAVRHGVSGAGAAYSRVTSASNYNLFTNDLATAPVWGVVPSGQTTTGEAMSTPGPKMRIGQLLPGKMAISGFRGMGITPDAAPTGSLLAKHVVGADPLSEFLWVADDKPAGLNLVVNEDSSAIASGTDGVYSGNKTVYTDGAPDPGTYSFTFGVAAATVTVAGTIGNAAAGGAQASVVNVAPGTITVAPGVGNAAATGAFATITNLDNTLRVTCLVGNVVAGGPRAVVVAGLGTIEVAPSRILVGTGVDQPDLEGTFVMRDKRPTIDKDPDADLFYAIELGPELAAQNASLVSVVALVVGVTESVPAFVQGTKVVVKCKAGVVSDDPDAVYSCTLRWTNTLFETDDRTFYFRMTNK